MESNTPAGVSPPRWRITTDGQAAVDPDYYWQPMETCPTHTKVQLLTEGGIAVYGKWDGKDTFYRQWAPCPKLKAPWHQTGTSKNRA